MRRDEAGPLPFDCPTCGGPLSAASESGWACPACERSHPDLGGVSCVMPDPEFWCTLWSQRLDDFLELSQQRQAQLASALGGAEAHWTRRRLQSLGEALAVQRSELERLFAPLRASAGRKRAQLPLRVPSSGGAVLKCYEHLFRDWAWGEAESSRSVSVVQRLLAAAGSERPRDLVVHGAGACRLAVDLHAALSPGRTLALDANPFPALVAARLLAGERLTLPELPVGPPSCDQTVVMQELVAPAAERPQLFLGFGDVLRPPLRSGSVGCVLTPWLLDAVDANVHDVVTAVNRSLEPGGVWLNVGPLRFDGPLTEAYSIEEVLEVARALGFEVVENFREDVDYFRSPNAGSRRVETVFCFAARKQADAAPRPASSAHASWLMNVQSAVPLTAAVTSLRRSSISAVGVLSLIDGKRSLEEIAGTLASQWKLPRAEVLLQLRAYLARLPLG